MDTYEKEFGNLVATFNNSNEYVECGPLYNKPKFAGVLIRKKFSSEAVELHLETIPFFLKKLTKIKYPGKETPLVKLINKNGWNNYRSDFVIVVSNYKGLRCRFFMGISHQLGYFDTIRTDSPEFDVEVIIRILMEANSLISDKDSDDEGEIVDYKI